MWKVSIPSTQTISQGLSTFVVYHIQISYGDSSWNTVQRYAAFDSLNEIVKKKYAKDHLPRLPPKKVIGNMGKDFVEERRRELQKYLQDLLQIEGAFADIQAVFHLPSSAAASTTVSPRSSKQLQPLADDPQQPKLPLLGNSLSDEDLGPDDSANPSKLSPTSSSSSTTSTTSTVPTTSPRGKGNAAPNTSPTLVSPASPLALVAKGHHRQSSTSKLTESLHQSRAETGTSPVTSTVLSHATGSSSAAFSTVAPVQQQQSSQPQPPAVARQMSVTSMFNEGQEPEAGMLRVKLFGAEGLQLSAPLAAIASTQPLALYCVVQLEKQQVCTKTTRYPPMSSPIVLGRASASGSSSATTTTTVGRLFPVSSQSLTNTPSSSEDLPSASSLSVVSGGSVSSGFSVQWNQEVSFDCTNPSAELVVALWAVPASAASALSPSPSPLPSPSPTPPPQSTTPQPGTSYSRLTYSSSPSSDAPASHALLLGRVTVPVGSLKHATTAHTDCFRINSSGTESGVLAGSLRLKLQYQVLSTGKVAKEDFELLKVVGKGNFGKVMLVRKKDTARLYAMKVVRKDRIIESDAVGHTVTERNVLRKMAHPFIVSLKYSFQTQEKLYMVLDYINGGELFFHLSRVERFSEERARFYAAEITMALGYLHEQRIIYRDLKPENLLLDMNGNVVLTDFGLVKENIGPGDRTYTFCGSPEYLAPEVITGKGYGPEVDWWALGTLIYEMLFGLPPFFDEDARVMNQRILHAPLTFDPVAGLSTAAKDLLQGMLTRDPLKRLGSGVQDAADIRKHAWFRSLDWKALYNKQVPPPFKPHLRHALDVQNFETEFTSEAPKDSYVPPPNLNGYENAFVNFSYVAPAELIREYRRKNSREVNSRLNTPTPQSAASSQPPVTPQSKIGTISNVAQPHPHHAASSTPLLQAPSSPSAYRRREEQLTTPDGSVSSDSVLQADEEQLFEIWQ